MISLSDIRSARERIAPHIRQTEVALDERVGVWLKWENHQTTGSFKLRGALNKILGLATEARTRGLIAASAGNHGQGVALAGRLAGARVRVFASEHAVSKKVQAMQDLGAEVVRVPGGYGDAERAAIAAARTSGEVWVSPYNDPAVIAGQGTLGLEILEQVPDAREILVPVGGGGLVAGVGLAVKALRPEVKIVGVQNETSKFMHEIYFDRDPDAVVELPSLADGLSGPVEPGSITIEIARQVVDEFLLVTEAEIEAAIRYAWTAHGETIEGSGAVGLAAVLAGKWKGRGGLLIVSGGNIDPDAHRRLVQT